MTYSQYAFVEAFINEQQKSWTTAHVHMYEFFGGVTPILVSDNAPTATNRKQSDKYESVLIKSYEELAQHYNTAIIPARVRAPKDKPTLPIVLINCYIRFFIHKLSSSKISVTKKSAQNRFLI